jgi:hypothetical protein
MMQAVTFGVVEVVQSLHQIGKDIHAIRKMMEATSGEADPRRQSHVPLQRGGD